MSSCEVWSDHEEQVQRVGRDGCGPGPDDGSNGSVGEVRDRPRWRLVGRAVTVMLAVASVAATGILVDTLGRTSGNEPVPSGPGRQVELTVEPVTTSPRGANDGVVVVSPADTGNALAALGWGRATAALAMGVALAAVPLVARSRPRATSRLLASAERRGSRRAGGISLPVTLFGSMLATIVAGHALVVQAQRSRPAGDAVASDAPFPEVLAGRADTVDSLLIAGGVLALGCLAAGVSVGVTEVRRSGHRAPIGVTALGLVMGHAVVAVVAAVLSPVLWIAVVSTFWTAVAVAVDFGLVAYAGVVVGSAALASAVVGAPTGVLVWWVSASVLRGAALIRRRRPTSDGSTRTAAAA